MPVGTINTATYVGMVVELCGRVMECISLCVYTSAYPTGAPVYIQVQRSVDHTHTTG